MPIYEYQCQACQAVTEAIQKLSDRPLTKCTSCGGRLEKLLSRTAFVLKGGGWYKDGYGGGKKRSSSEGSGSSGSGDGGGKSSSGGEGKGASQESKKSGGSSSKSSD